MKVPGGDAAGGVKKKDKDYELSSSDTFWTSHKGSPFPQVVGSIESTLPVQSTMNTSILQTSTISLRM